MMGKVNALVVRSLRMSTSELGSISQKGVERDHRIVVSFPDSHADFSVLGTNHKTSMIFVVEIVVSAMPDL